MNKSRKPIVIIGAGVSGLAAALELLEHGQKVILIEKNDRIGGAAASISIPENRTVAAGYHHIVGSDKELIRFLNKLNLISRVRWIHTKTSTLSDNKEVDLSSPFDILRYKRLSLLARLRYLFFGGYCVITNDWSNWQSKNVTKLIKTLAGSEVLDKIFRPLIDIKFGISTDLADAAWLGKRLHHREGATKFGFIPNASWTQELCNAFSEKIIQLGGVIKTNTSIKNLEINSRGKIVTVSILSGQKIAVKALISTVPPPILKGILGSSAPQKWLATLSKIKYISTYSLIAGLSKNIFKSYWNIFLHPRKIFGACFVLTNLNHTLITRRDKSIVNISTNFIGRPPYTIKNYEKKVFNDLSEILGTKIKPNWVITGIIENSSPIFGVNYKNPPMRLGPNLFLAGIYRTYPKFSSTGEAMANGEETAKKVLRKIS